MFEGIGWLDFILVFVCLVNLQSLVCTFPKQTLYDDSVNYNLISLIYVHWLFFKYFLLGMYAIRAERDYVVNEDFMKAVRKVADTKKLETKLDYKQV